MEDIKIKLLQDENIRFKSEIEYYKKHISYIENENERLKTEKSAVDLQLNSYHDGEKISIKATKNMLCDAVTSFNLSKKLNKELKEKIKLVNQLLTDLRSIKPKYIQQCNQILKDVTNPVK